MVRGNNNIKILKQRARFCRLHISANNIAAAAAHASAAAIEPYKPAEAEADRERAAAAPSASPATSRPTQSATADGGHDDKENTPQPQANDASQPSDMKKWKKRLRRRREVEARRRQRQWCAVRIQAAFRGHKARHRAGVEAERRRRERCAVPVQAAFRGLRARHRAGVEAERRRCAARIQAIFRGHRGRLAYARDVRRITYAQNLWRRHVRRKGNRAVGRAGLPCQERPCPAPRRPWPDAEEASFSYCPCLDLVDLVTSLTIEAAASPARLDSSVLSEEGMEVGELSFARCARLDEEEDATKQAQRVSDTVYVDPTPMHDVIEQVGATDAAITGILAAATSIHAFAGGDLGGSSRPDRDIAPVSETSPAQPGQVCQPPPSMGIHEAVDAHCARNANSMLALRT